MGKACNFISIYFSTFMLLFIVHEIEGENRSNHTNYANDASDAQKGFGPIKFS